MIDSSTRMLGVPPTGSNSLIIPTCYVFKIRNLLIYVLTVFVSRNIIKQLSNLPVQKID